MTCHLLDWRSSSGPKKKKKKRKKDFTCFRQMTVAITFFLNNVGKIPHDKVLATNLVQIWVPPAKTFQLCS